MSPSVNSPLLSERTLSPIVFLTTSLCANIFKWRLFTGHLNEHDSGIYTSLCYKVTYDWRESLRLGIVKPSECKAHV